MQQINIKDMLNCGVHFGHQTHRWNPKMKNYVYGERGGIHIIDLQKTLGLAQKAGEFIRSIAAGGGRMIFVGTKKQANEPIQEAAQKCGQFYVTKRWLGGTLTNFVTIKASIDRLRKLDIMKEKGDFNYYGKKEQAQLEKEFVRLHEYLDGIRDMKELPRVMFVVDLKKEHIAVAEARRMGITVVGIADTNSDPDEIDFPIPGNDDAIRSIKLFANYAAECFLEGAKDWEHKLRTETDKRAPEKEAPTTAHEETRTEGGPSVVRMTKRKLVAVGTADDVEIQAELEGAAEPDAAEGTESTEEDKE